ncbi:hypothetical protein MASR2M47_21740 [Draconibacterium sp.]
MDNNAEGPPDQTGQVGRENTGTSWLYGTCSTNFYNHFNPPGFKIRPLDLHNKLKDMFNLKDKIKKKA